MSLLDRSLPQASGLPRLELGNWPTPVTKLERLGKRLHCELWLKRDDQSARPYGGNKIRKLELLLADAMSRRAQTLVTVGGFGSSHLVATAVYGSRLGLSTQGVVAPQPPSEIARTNALLAAAAGARFHPCRSRAHIPLGVAAALAKSTRPYFIGPGGSSPLGTLGYVFAALELKEQILRGQLPQPREIFVPLGSGGTAAGLAIGLALANIPARLAAVRVVERPLCNAVLLQQLIVRTTLFLRRLGAHNLRTGNWVVVEGQAGVCYGDVTKSARKAMALLAETEGLTLEPTYSGKAMAALVEAVCRGSHPKGPVLFWHTANSRDVTHMLSPDAATSVPGAMKRWLEI